MSFNTHELAWCAGFFDGEGCTYRRRDGGLLLEISQKEFDPIKRFHKTFNVGRLKQYRHRNSMSGYDKMIYKLAISNFQHVQYVMAMMWKYLSPIKRQQYKIAVTAYLKNCKKNNYSMPKGAIESRYFRRYRTKIGFKGLDRKVINNKSNKLFINPFTKKSVSDYKVIDVTGNQLVESTT